MKIQDRYSSAVHSSNLQSRSETTMSDTDVLGAMGIADRRLAVPLAWFRNSACQSCGGHGFKIIPGTKTLGDSRCRPCDGTGKVPLELGFRIEQRELVRWAVAQMEREVAMAGPAAMKALKPLLEF